MSHSYPPSELTELYKPFDKAYFFCRPLRTIKYIFRSFQTFGVVLFPEVKYVSTDDTDLRLPVRVQCILVPVGAKLSSMRLVMGEREPVRLPQ